MKKRTIFDTASWLDLQTRKPTYEQQRAAIERLKKPLTPDQDVNMETEAAGHESQVQIQKEKIVEMIDNAKQDIAESIKIELQPPKGYILFPEPEDTGEETTYTVQEETDDSES